MGNKISNKSKNKTIEYIEKTPHTIPIEQIPQEKMPNISSEENSGKTLEVTSEGTSGKTSNKNSVKSSSNKSNENITKYSPILNGISRKLSESRRSREIDDEILLEKNNGKVLIYGLDNSGKMTIFNFLIKNESEIKNKSIIVENEKIIEIDKYKITFIDINGQKTEKCPKYLNSFSDVCMVIFVVASDEIEKNENTNIHVSLNLFEETINSEYFKNIPIFLLLNKEDLFIKKIKDRNLIIDEFLNEYNVNYENLDIDILFAYIRNKFISKNRKISRDIICRITNATNNKFMEYTSQIIIAEILQIITKRNIFS